MKIKVGVITYDFFPFLGGLGRGLYEIYYRRLMNDPDLEFFFFSPSENNLPNHTQIAKFSRIIGFHFAFSIVVNINIARWVNERNLDIISLHGGAGGGFF